MVQANFNNPSDRGEVAKRREKNEAQTMHKTRKPLDGNQSPRTEAISAGAKGKKVGRLDSPSIREEKLESLDQLQLKHLPKDSPRRTVSLVKIGGES
jgi:hypothetical protein